MCQHVLRCHGGAEPPLGQSELSWIQRLKSLSGDMNNMWAHLTVEPGADSTAVLNAAQAIAKSVQCSHCCFQVEDSGTYDRSVEVHHQCCMAGEVKSPRQSVNVD